MTWALSKMQRIFVGLLTLPLLPLRSLQLLDSGGGGLGDRVTLCLLWQATVEGTWALLGHLPQPPGCIRTLP